MSVFFTHLLCKSKDTNIKSTVLNYIERGFIILLLQMPCRWSSLISKIIKAKARIKNTHIIAFFIFRKKQDFDTQLESEIFVSPP